MAKFELPTDRWWFQYRIGEDDYEIELDFEPDDIGEDTDFVKILRSVVMLPDDQELEIIDKVNYYHVSN